MDAIDVECTFRADGQVSVRRVQIDGTWQPVEQGRQWQDEAGRHVLIMRPGRQVEELLMRAEDLRWHLVRRPGPRAV